MNSIWMVAAAEEQQFQTSEDIPAGEQQQQQSSQQNGGPTPADDTAKPAPNPLMQLLPIILIFAVMYLFLFRGPKKKQQEHQKMVQALKKNDRVRTIGGILGTVMDVRDDEIVLKVDESTNTKMRVIPAAIAAVLSEKTE